MAVSGRVVSAHFPYLPLTVTLRGRTAIVEALLDTGFDGDIALPAGFVLRQDEPDGSPQWTLADGSEIRTPVYLGTVQVGDFAALPITITIVGSEAIVGRGVTDRFTVILDRGRQVVIED